MAVKTYTTRDSGEAYLAPNGPGYEPTYLNCYDIGDIAEDRGSINELIQCFNGEGGWDTLGYTLNSPGTFSIDLGTYVGKRKELLSGAVCPASLYLFLRCGGKAGLLGNYERGLIIDLANIATHTRTNWVMRNTDAAAEESFSAEALPPVYELEKLKGRRVSLSEASAINGIKFCNSKRCAGPCGAAKDICEDGFMITDSLSGSPAAVANVLFTSDGSTWVAGATDPFAAAENIMGQHCFDIDANTTRHLVGRGTTDVGNPAEIAYTDDGGATWTNVDLPTPNGQFIIGNHAIYGIGKRVWVVTNAGYIVYSGDGGETWEAQESAVIQAGIYYSVYFEDIFTGMATAAADVVAVTTDGGQTWSAATATGGGGDLLVNGYSGLFWYVGTDDGDLYRSDDLGDTWTQITGFTGSGTGAIKSMDWSNKYQGYLVQNIAGVGYVLETFDGGASWYRIDGPTNGGLNYIYACATDLIWTAGEVVSGSGFLVKVSAAS